MRLDPDKNHLVIFNLLLARVRFALANKKFANESDVVKLNERLLAHLKDGSGDLVEIQQLLKQFGSFLKALSPYLGDILFGSVKDAYNKVIESPKFKNLPELPSPPSPPESRPLELPRPELKDKKDLHPDKPGLHEALINLYISLNDLPTTDVEEELSATASALPHSDDVGLLKFLILRIIFSTDLSKIKDSLGPKIKSIVQGSPQVQAHCHKLLALVNGSGPTLNGLHEVKITPSPQKEKSKIEILITPEIYTPLKKFFNDLDKLIKQTKIKLNPAIVRLGSNLYGILKAYGQREHPDKNENIYLSHVPFGIKEYRDAVASLGNPDLEAQYNKILIALNPFAKIKHIDAGFSYLRIKNVTLRGQKVEVQSRIVLRFINKDDALSLFGLLGLNTQEACIIGNSLYIFYGEEVSFFDKLSNYLRVSPEASASFQELCKKINTVSPEKLKEKPKSSVASKTLLVPIESKRQGTPVKLEQKRPTALTPSENSTGILVLQSPTPSPERSPEPESGHLEQGFGTKEKEEKKSATPSPRLSGEKGNLQKKCFALDQSIQALLEQKPQLAEAQIYKLIHLRDLIRDRDEAESESDSEAVSQPNVKTRYKVRIDSLIRQRAIIESFGNKDLNEKYDEVLNAISDQVLFNIEEPELRSNPFGKLIRVCCDFDDLQEVPMYLIPDGMDSHRFEKSPINFTFENAEAALAFCRYVELEEEDYYLNNNVLFLRKRYHEYMSPFENEKAAEEWCLKNDFKKSDYYIKDNAVYTRASQPKAMEKILAKLLEVSNVYGGVVTAQANYIKDRYENVNEFTERSFGRFGIPKSEKLEAAFTLFLQTVFRNPRLIWNEEGEKALDQQDSRLGKICAETAQVVAEKKDLKNESPDESFVFFTKKFYALLRRFTAEHKKTLSSDSYKSILSLINEIYVSGNNYNLEGFVRRVAELQKIISNSEIPDLSKLFKPILNEINLIPLRGVVGISCHIDKPLPITGYTREGEPVEIASVMTLRFKSTRALNFFCLSLGLNETQFLKKGRTLYIVKGQEVIEPGAVLPSTVLEKILSRLTEHNESGHGLRGYIETRMANPKPYKTSIGKLGLGFSKSEKIQAALSLLFDVAIKPEVRLCNSTVRKILSGMDSRLTKINKSLTGIFKAKSASPPQLVSPTAQAAVASPRSSLQTQTKVGDEQKETKGQAESDSLLSPGKSKPPLHPPHGAHLSHKRRPHESKRHSGKTPEPLGSPPSVSPGLSLAVPNTKVSGEVKEIKDRLDLSNGLLSPPSDSRFSLVSPPSAHGKDPQQWTHSQKAKILKDIFSSFKGIKCKFEDPYYEVDDKKAVIKLSFSDGSTKMKANPAKSLYQFCEKLGLADVVICKENDIYVVKGQESRFLNLITLNTAEPLCQYIVTRMDLPEYKREGIFKGTPRSLKIEAAFEGLLEIYGRKNPDPQLQKALSKGELGEAYRSVRKTKITPDVTPSHSPKTH